MRFVRAFVWILRISHDQIKEEKYSNQMGPSLGKIMWRSSTQYFTHRNRESKVEMKLPPLVMNSCQCADLHTTHIGFTTFSNELLYRIS